MLVRAPHGNVVGKRDAETLRKVATFALAVAGFALAAGLVMIARTFVFDYFHGNRAAAQAFARLLFG